MASGHLLGLLSLRTLKAPHELPGEDTRAPQPVLWGTGDAGA